MSAGSLVMGVSSRCCADVARIKMSAIGPLVLLYSRGVDRSSLLIDTLGSKGLRTLETSVAGNVLECRNRVNPNGSAS